MSHKLQALLEYFGIMVSSFDIETNIRVDNTTAEAFNEIADFDSNSIDRNVLVRKYFDSSDWATRTGVESLETFLKWESEHPGHRERCQMWGCNDWMFNDDHILYDSCEKFHFAVQVLMFRIT